MSLRPGSESLDPENWRCPLLSRSPALFLFVLLTRCATSNSRSPTDNDPGAPVLFVVDSVDEGGVDKGDSYNIYLLLASIRMNEGI